MASRQDKLQKRVREIISRPKNVEFEEIESVMRDLGASSRATRHGVIFSLKGCSKLMLNRHNNGKKHLPSYCVKEFCERMVELGLYDRDEGENES